MDFHSKLNTIEKWSLIHVCYLLYIFIPAFPSFAPHTLCSGSSYYLSNHCVLTYSLPFCCNYLRYCCKVGLFLTLSLKWRNLSSVFEVWNLSFFDRDACMKTDITPLAQMGRSRAQILRLLGLSGDLILFRGSKKIHISSSSTLKESNWGFRGGWWSTQGT